MLGRDPLIINQIQSRQQSRRVKPCAVLPSMKHCAEDWLNFNANVKHRVLFNSVTLPLKWLLWTTRGMASLKSNANIRERLCNQAASLGSVAGLYLVIAVAGFLTPPAVDHDQDKTLRNVFGVLMFFGAISLTFYICISLTVIYPLMESIPDYTAYEAHENMLKRWGGYEQFLFNFGAQSVLVALVIAAKVLYSIEVAYIAIGIFFCLYWVGAFLTRDNFLAIDPITSMHMGLSNNPDDVSRALRLADKIRKATTRAKSQSIVSDISSRVVESPSKKWDSSPEPLKAVGKDEDYGFSSRSESKERSKVYTIGSGSRLEDNDSEMEERPFVAPILPAQQLTADPAVQEKSAEGQKLRMHMRQPRKAFIAHENIPTLEAILLGEARLLHEEYMDEAEARHIYSMLRKQGCRSTERLLNLLGNLVVCLNDDFGEEPEEGRSCNFGATYKARLDTLSSFDIPTFHVMELLNFLEEYLG